MLELTDLVARCTMVTIEAIALIYFMVTARRFVISFYKPISKRFTNSKEKKSTNESVVVLRTT